MKNQGTLSTTLTRRVKFSALHELCNPSWTDAQNEEVFGKCFRNHGHDYWVDVTVTGSIDPLSGLLCDRDHLETVLKENVTDRFHGTQLNDFFNFTSGEVLVQELFGILKTALSPISLVSVTLRETPKNYFTFSDHQSLYY